MNKQKKIVIALGGNALEDKSLESTAENQLKIAKKTSEYIADICCDGYEIAIVHGNGPQVGRIVMSTEASSNITPSMPFDVCGAMSQGYIGYHIQQGLRHALMKKNKNIPVVSIVTQVVVDKNDEAFFNPTKPIGAFYSEEKAKELEEKQGYNMKEDAGRGWRRVVASPKPQRIVELDIIKSLWGNSITIACGGGGIPVVENSDGSLSGVAAVIDKDFAAAKLAIEIDAEILLILTEVENVALNFNKPTQKLLSKVSTNEIQKYIDEGHFAAGSMLPKVMAAKKFAESKPGRKAIITSLFKATEALSKNTGTIIEM